MEDSLCEKEFLRIGLSFWTGQPQGAVALDFLATFDSHTAASVGDLEFLADLPQSQLDRSNWSGWTPLMYASYQGHLSLVSSLLARGCAVSKTNNKGRTPLILSAMCGNREITSLFLTSPHSSDLLAAADQRNMTALSHAVRWGHLQLAQDLLVAGADPSTTEHSRGHSLLMMAAEEGNLAMVELLLSFSADTSYRTVLGDTAVTVAEARGHQALARLILKSSPSPSPSSLSAPARLRMMMEERRLSAGPSPASLTELLSELGLEKYGEMFLQNDIDLPLLLTMSDQQLRQIGITKLGPRRKLTAAIERIKEEKKIIE